jgi:hypothetical protein
LEQDLVLGLGHPGAGEVGSLRADRQPAEPPALRVLGFAAIVVRRAAAAVSISGALAALGTHAAMMPPERSWHRMTMRGRVLAGSLVTLVGLVWIGQGLGILRSSSFMVDDARWALIGVVMVVVGVALLWKARRRRA